MGSAWPSLERSELSTNKLNSLNNKPRADELPMKFTSRNECGVELHG